MQIPNARAIRSYVLRAGRMTPAQQRALTQLWPLFGIEFSAGPLDLDALFGRSAARTLEIGFGNGEHLLERASAQPERDFLGVEVHRPGVGHLLLAAEKAGTHNLRVIAHDAMEVLQQQLSAASLDEVQVLFPDPWPKKRHHKRRLVQPEFVNLVAAKMRSGARFHLATDWEPYADDMVRVLGGCEQLVNLGAADGFADALSARTATRFERRGTRLGHRVRELLFARR